jgi:hypothetical protein
VDVAQGTPDALGRQASQGPAEEREVETASRDVALDGRGDIEVNALAELRRSRRLRSSDRVLVRIDSEDLLCRAHVPPGQAAVAAADLENAQAGEVDDAREGGELGARGRALGAPWK